MCAFVDHGEHGTGQALAVDLRPGMSSAWDRADHFATLNAALAQLPEPERGQVLVSTDAAPDQAWRAAIDSDGEPRDSPVRRNHSLDPVTGPRHQPLRGPQVAAPDAGHRPPRAPAPGRTAVTDRPQRMTITCFATNAPKSAEWIERLFHERNHILGAPGLGEEQSVTPVTGVTIPALTCEDTSDRSHELLSPTRRMSPRLGLRSTAEPGLSLPISHYQPRRPKVLGRYRARRASLARSASSDPVADGASRVFAVGGGQERLRTGVCRGSRCALPTSRTAATVARGRSPSMVKPRACERLRSRVNSDEMDATSMPLWTRSVRRPDQAPMPGTSMSRNTPTSPWRLGIAAHHRCSPRSVWTRGGRHRRSPVTFTLCSP